MLSFLGLAACISFVTAIGFFVILAVPFLSFLSSVGLLCAKIWLPTRAIAKDKDFVREIRPSQLRGVFDSSDTGGISFMDNANAG
jgi:hypothetical protein